MDLPKQVQTVYHTQLPSDKKKRVSFTPFLVREQKALLTAQVSEDPKVMFNTVKAVLKASLVTPLNVEKLAVFDFEHLFMKLREVSVGEFSRLRFFCANPACADNPKSFVERDIDIREVKTEAKPGHVSLIPLFDDVSVQMKYMTVEKLDLLDDDEDGKEKTDLDGMFDMVAACVECVFDGEKKFDAADFTSEQMRAFLYSLTGEQFSRIEQFFATCPKPSLTVEYTCPECGKHHKNVLEGMKSFF